MNFLVKSVNVDKKYIFIDLLDSLYMYLGRLVRWVCYD